MRWPGLINEIKGQSHKNYNTFLGLVSLYNINLHRYSNINLYFYILGFEFSIFNI